jgi:phosphoglycolate phosphatase
MIQSIPAQGIEEKRVSVPPVVVFDLDGTLFDTGPDLLAALNRVLAEEGMTAAPAASVADLFGHGGKALITRAYELAGIALPADRVSHLIERFVAHYGDNIATGTLPYPGLADALTRLSQRGIKLAVCTNKREALAVRLLEVTGYAGHFGAVIGGDSLAVAKPHPEPLLAAIERIGGKLGNAVMVGDSATDVATARAVGIPVIAVDFGFSGLPVDALGADAVIAHYDQLDGALAAVHPAFG